MDNASRRRDNRQINWRGGVSRSFTEHEDVELAWWLAVSPEDRLAYALEMSQVTFGNGEGIRFDRAVGGVRSRKE